MHQVSLIVLHVFSQCSSSTSDDLVGVLSALENAIGAFIKTELASSEVKSSTSKIFDFRMKLRDDWFCAQLTKTLQPDNPARFRYVEKDTYMGRVSHENDTMIRIKFF